VEANEKVIEKIHKILKLGKDASATEGEALNAVALAQRLLAKHNLAMADVESYGERLSDKRAEKEWKRDVAEAAKPRQFFSQFEQYIQGAVQDLCGVKAVLFRNRGPNGRTQVRLTFIGEQADTAVACALYIDLIKLCKRCAHEYAGQGWSPVHRSYAEGWGIAVRRKAAETQTQQATGLDDREQQQYAIIVRSKAAWLAEQLAAAFPNLVQLKIQSRGKQDCAAREAGYQRGKQTNLSTKVFES